jgi:hypothetical protein
MPLTEDVEDVASAVAIPAQAHREETTDRENIVDSIEGTTTRSGRVVQFPLYLQEHYETTNVGIDNNVSGLTTAEENYYAAMATTEYGLLCVDRDGVEATLVGAGVGDGFANTNELHVIKYADTMASMERPLWLKAIDEEYRTLTDYGVFQPVESCKIPPR